MIKGLVERLRQKVTSIEEKKRRKKMTVVLALLNANTMLGPLPMLLVLLFNAAVARSGKD